MKQSRLSLSAKIATFTEGGKVPGTNGAVLDISEELAAKMKSTSEANQAARREAMAGFQDKSQKERQAAMAKLAESGIQSLLALRSESQVKKLETLKGAALTIDFAPLRPARGNRVNCAYRRNSFRETNH